MFTHEFDTFSLVKAPAYKLTVDTSVSRDFLHHKPEILLEECLCIVKLLHLSTHDDDLIYGPAVIFRHRSDAQILRKRFSPPFYLTVSLRLILQELIHIFVAPGTVLCLYRAENSLPMQRIQSHIPLFICHRQVKQNLVPYRYITPGAGHNSVKSVDEQRREHIRIASCTQKDLMSACPGFLNRIQRAGRWDVLSRYCQCTVNIKKDKLHHTDPLSVIVYPSFTCFTGSCLLSLPFSIMRLSILVAVAPQSS